MNKINRGRFTADIDGAFVVFLIGMRINQPWKVHRWLPIFFKMPRMLRELYQDPNSGFLGHVGTLTMIQYWRSYDQLEAYARNRDKSHWPAWVDFQRSVSNSNGEVGIWHETYCDSQRKGLTDNSFDVSLFVPLSSARVLVLDLCFVEPSRQILKARVIQKHLFAAPRPWGLY